MKRLILIISLFFIIACSFPAKRNWCPFDLNYSWNETGYSARVSSYDKTGANADSIMIQPGETAVLADIKGAGIIRHIWFTTNGSGPVSRALILKMYWDGSSKPSVEVPYGDFFCAGNGIDADVSSYPITVSSNGRAKNCWWQMPFSEGARITITNEGAEQLGAFYYYIDYLAFNKPMQIKERFYAQYKQAYPANFPGNYVILETQGKGHYVGTVMSFVGTKPNWWGEGDDLIEVDNYKPLYGTGTEDYFCYAWGMNTHSTLWHGSPICDGFSAPGQKTSIYRFHILDSIPFYKKFKISIEHGTENDRADNISSVAFWYQEPPASDFPKMPLIQERLLGEERASFIRNEAWNIAYNTSETSIKKLENLLSLSDSEDNKILISGLLIYAKNINEANDANLRLLDESLDKMEKHINTIPEDKRYSKPKMDLPTDNDSPVSCPAIASRKILERARYQFAFKNSLKRELIPGDEIIMESRDLNGNITKAPAYIETSDFKSSYAKVDDPRLIGQGSRFTYGNADPSYAAFTPNFPKKGKYEVFVIFSYGANAGDTRYEIKSADGSKTINLKQLGRADTPGRNNDIWHSLGIFRFEAGENQDKGSVVLNASPGKEIPNEKFEYRAYSDAVRFVYIE